MFNIHPNKSKFFRSLSFLGELKHYLFAFVIFLIGTLLTIAAYYFYTNEEKNQLRVMYERIADARLLLIKTVINDTLQQFDYIKQIFSISNKKADSQQVFHTLVHNSITRYPNILAIGWIPNDSKSNPNSLHLGFNFISNEAADVRKNQLFSFELLELGNIRKPFYFDLEDYPKFIKDYKKSQSSSSMIVSEPIDYYQDGDKRGFFIFNPVFNEKILDRALDAPMALKGLIIGFSDLNQIVQDVRIQVEPLGININIYDVTEGKEDLILYNPSRIYPDPANVPPHLQKQQEAWALNTPVKVANRNWKLKATPSVYYLSEHAYKYPWTIFFIGMSISFLTASYFFFLVNRRISIEKQVKQRTEELAEINRILQDEVHSRQKVELEIIKQQNYLQARHEALEHLTKLTISEIRTAIQEVILRTAAVMQIDRVSIWFEEMVEGKQILSCAGVYNLSTHSFSDHLKFDSDYFPHYFQILTQHKDLIIPSVDFAEVNLELASYLAAFNIISKLDIPIIFEGKLLGVLCCEETRGPREWNLEDRHFGHTIADIVAIMIEQEARRKAENALKERDARISYITQKATDAIISVSSNDEIISWNFGAEQMFEYPEPEMIGKSLSLIIPDENLQLGTTKPIELMGKRKNGQVFPIELSHSRWKAGTEHYDSVIIRDITERKEHEKKLIKAMREAHAANQAKSEFLTVVSHELRTPLNAIIGYNQCLLIGMDGPVTEPQKVSLRKIEKSSFHLLELINDILDLAKIEANKMELEITPQNIVETLLSCVDEIQSLARQKNLKIQVFFDKPYILMEYDKTRIRQVILNLLSNALKFTEKGMVKVTLINYPQQVEIQVEDTGIGISPDEIIKLFMAFSQADSSITRKYGGTGLGLAISKKIVDMHGGSIDVQSTVSKGSIFTIRLPKIQ